MSFIEIENITKIYGSGDAEVRALDGVTLTIEEGELVAIMGVSGSGKSTFINIIGALDKPTSGTYKLKNNLVSKMNDYSLSKFRSEMVGFVFQQFNLLPRFSNEKNVAMGLLYTPQKGSKKRVRDTLDMVGLEKRYRAKPTQLSGGQQQRVAIARALVKEPSLVIADEPTGNLDTKTSDSIMEILIELHNKKHSTMLMVTHEQKIANYCKRIINFADGKIISDEVNKKVM